MGSVEPKTSGLAICVLAAIQLVSWGTCFYVFGLTLVPIETDLGLSRGSTALAFPAALLLEGLCSVIVGRWIARNLGAHVMGGGSMLAGAGLWMLSQANSLLQFQAAWALIGASFACTLYTPLFSLIATEFPTSYRRKVTAISLITGFSSTLFLPLGGWLMAEIGWRNCLLLYAMLNILLCAPGHWFALKAIHSTTGSFIHAAAVGQAAGTQAPVASHGRRHIYVYLAVFTSAIGALSATMAAHLIPMLMERGVPAEIALLAPAAIGALQTLSRVPMLVGCMDGKVHHLNFALILIFPVAILLLQAAGADSFLLIIFVVLYGVAHGGWTIVRATAVPQYLGPQGAAVINGTIAFWGTIGRITLPALVAFLWTSDQGYGDGYWLLLAVAILGFLAYALAQKTYFGRLL
jgi:MFS family permease